MNGAKDTMFYYNMIWYIFLFSTEMHSHIYPLPTSPF